MKASVEMLTGMVRLHDDSARDEDLPYVDYSWCCTAQFLQDRSVCMIGALDRMPKAGYLAIDKKLASLGYREAFRYHLENGVLVKRDPWILGKNL